MLGEAEGLIEAFIEAWNGGALSGTYEGERFKATGTRVVDQGWKTVFGAEEADEEDELPSYGPGRKSKPVERPMKPPEKPKGKVGGGRQPAATTAARPAAAKKR